MIEIVPVDLLHIREICDTMRARERKAFEEHGIDPERKITNVVAGSIQSYAGVRDGQTIAIGGLQARGLFADEGYVWFIASAAVEEQPIPFLRGSRSALALVRPMFKRIYGLVLDEFVASVRWLEWLGFNVDQPENGLRLFWLGGRPTAPGAEILTKDIPLFSTTLQGS